MEWPTFFGRRGQSATEYLEEIQCNIDVLSLDDVKAERQKRVRFRQGLEGTAKQWWEYEFTGDKESMKEVEAAFLLRFSKTSPHSALILREVLTFTRRNGEALKAYMKQAEKLRRKISEKDHNLILAMRLLSEFRERHRHPKPNHRSVGITEENGGTWASGMLGS